MRPRKTHIKQPNANHPNTIQEQSIARRQAERERDEARVQLQRVLTVLDGGCNFQLGPGGEHQDLQSAIRNALGHSARPNIRQGVDTDSQIAALEDMLTDVARSATTYKRQRDEARATISSLLLALKALAPYPPDVAEGVVALVTSACAS